MANVSQLAALSCACTPTCCSACRVVVNLPNLVLLSLLLLSFAHGRSSLFAELLFLSRARSILVAFFILFQLPQTPPEGFQEHRDARRRRLRRAGGVCGHGSRCRFSRQGELRGSRAWTRTLMHFSPSSRIASTAAVLNESGMPETDSPQRVSAQRIAVCDGGFSPM